jgi:hypothetical protein
MKQSVLFCLACIMGITIAGNVTNQTLSMDNDLFVNDDNESFYTVDVLLVPDGVSIPKFG